MQNLFFIRVKSNVRTNHDSKEANSFQVLCNICMDYLLHFMSELAINSYNNFCCCSFEMIWKWFSA